MAVTHPIKNYCVYEVKDGKGVFTCSKQTRDCLFFEQDKAGCLWMDWDYPICHNKKAKQLAKEKATEE
jgi:hypothetical protein